MQRAHLFRSSINWLLKLSILSCLCFIALPVAPALAVCCDCIIQGKDVCLTVTQGTCETVSTAYSLNPNVRQAACQLTDDINCTAEGGFRMSDSGGDGASIPVVTEICKEKADAGTYGVILSSESEKAYVPVVPNLEITIPGLTFAQAPSIEGEGRNKTLDLPFLNQYISAAYRYLIGISVIAAAIMIVYGGFLYIVGGTFTSINKGKDIIWDAVIGLFLVFAIFTIIQTLNPRITETTSLHLPLVQTDTLQISEQDFQNQQWLATLSGYTPDSNIQGILQKYPNGERPTRKLPNNPFDDRMSIPLEDLDKILAEISVKFDIDACVLKAIVFTESGLNQNAIGNDEDVPRVEIQSRLDFLRSGVTYRGKRFELPDPLPEDCSGANRPTCEEILKKTSSIKNDDYLTETPPYYGLDWRFTKGFGIGQVTILGKNSPTTCYGSDGSIGRSIGGKCFTVPILLRWEGQLEAMILLIKNRTSSADACSIFNAYAGSGVDPNCTGRLSKKMNAYNTCKGTQPGT